MMNVLAYTTYALDAMVRQNWPTAAFQRTANRYKRIKKASEAGQGPAEATI